MEINLGIKSTGDYHIPTAARQIQTVLIALLLAISIVFITCKVVYAANAPTTAVKWHPGHYYTIMGNKNNPKYMAQVYRELKKTPALRGVQIRYEWAELEPAENMYDFTSIERRLAELAAQKKRLIILLQMKSFNPASAFVPDYLKREDSIFPFSTFGKKNIVRGYNLKLWNPLVHDRMVALISALGKRFNSHPYFEGIGLTETAFGQPMVEVSKNQLDSYYGNLLSINQQLRKHFPNTMTFQFTNYPRSMLKPFISKLREMGTGLGGPDIFMDDPGLIGRESKNSAKGVYHHYPELSGIIPLTPSVMQQNYVNTRHDQKGKTPTVDELFSFARDKLKANYIFWTRAPKYYPQVLEMLDGLGQTGDSGGLDSTCPKAYPSCVD